LHSLCLCLSQLLFQVQDVLSELCPLGRGHGSEEGLHPSDFCFDRLLVDHARAVSGVVSLLLASVTHSLYMYSVLPAQHVSRSCGTQSTGSCVSHRQAFVHALVKPCQECGCSGCHVIIHIVAWLSGVHLPPFAFMFR